MGLFQSNGSLTSISSTYFNTSVNGLLLSARYNSSQAYISTRNGNRTVSIPTTVYNQSGSSINISNIQLDYPGTVMFGVSLGNNTAPSQEQLMNCQDASNATLNSCIRFIVNDGNTINSMIIQNVTGSGLYKVYYLPTNDFVERPVAVGQVSMIMASNVYTINLPVSLSLTKEGCSAVQTATINPNTSTNDYVRIGNGVLSSQYGLYLRDQSDNNLQFSSSGSASQSFVVCSYTNTSTGNLTVPLTVVGNPNAQYILNTNNIVVTVLQPATPTPPVIDNDPVYNGSSGTINFTSSRTGSISWTFKEKSSSIGRINLSE